MLPETLFVSLCLFHFLFHSFPVSIVALHNVFLHGVQSEYLFCNTSMCVMSNVSQASQILNHQLVLSESNGRYINTQQLNWSVFFRYFPTQRLLQTFCCVKRHAFTSTCPCNNWTFHAHFYCSVIVRQAFSPLVLLYYLTCV